MGPLYCTRKDHLLILFRVVSLVLRQSWDCTDASEVKSLTHWGQVTHICLGKLTIIGSDNGFAPGRRQAIIWTNAGIFLIGPLRTKFNEILIEIHAFSLKKIHLKRSSVKWWPFCLGPNVLKGFCTMDQQQATARRSKVWYVYIFYGMYTFPLISHCQFDFIP